ncbi:flagellar FlbD family protein [Gracilibacillus alcaliphilus]|uniref:flagellar FlbD family protein n=1 Tax=Gracilibacillus alcaliphilus TaxID=1401441 RepID=UPI00195B8984|nr:flagellar FlbD family protein [Gracilibacillus alcaliphilus]MBM7677941.1 flagellar protein FlbD [Gracilibacillus alcaliphilus]
MITLTKLNNQKLTINAVYIERVEELPDTTITLVNNKKVFVKESGKEVKQLVTAFYKEIGLFRFPQEVGEQGHEF